jgi:hypothetical protein
MGAIDELKTAAHATLTEQRREFARGDIGDLDRLEDALASVSDVSILESALAIAEARIAADRSAAWNALRDSLVDAIAVLRRAES